MKNPDNQITFVAALIFVFLPACAGIGVGQMPDSLEGQIDHLTKSVGYLKDSKQYFIQLGPQAVPIVTEKLIQSLQEDVSIAGAKEKSLRACLFRACLFSGI